MAESYDDILDEMSSSSPQLCRLCLVKDENAHSIFSEDGIENEIRLKIESLLMTKVYRNDNWPQIICRACCDKLNSFNEFYDQVKKTESVLVNLFGRQDQKDENISVQIQEEDMDLGGIPPEVVSGDQIKEETPSENDNKEDEDEEAEMTDFMSKVPKMGLNLTNEVLETKQVVIQLQKTIENNLIKTLNVLSDLLMVHENDSSLISSTTSPKPDISEQKDSNKPETNGSVPDAPAIKKEPEAKTSSPSPSKSSTSSYKVKSQIVQNKNFVAIPKRSHMPYNLQTFNYKRLRNGDDYDYKQNKTCNHCGMHFRNKYELKIHVWQVHRIFYQCRNCPETFTSKMKLDLHTEKCNRICPHCFKVFKSTFNLYQHKQTTGCGNEKFLSQREDV